MVSVDQLAFITSQAASFVMPAPKAMLATAVGNNAGRIVVAASLKKMPWDEGDSATLRSKPPSRVIDDSAHSLRPDDDAAGDRSGDENDIMAKEASVIGPIHFCFIVHGHQGRPTDLSYLHHAVKAKADEKGAFAYAKSSDGLAAGGEKVTGFSASADGRNERNGAARRRGKRDRLPFSRNKSKTNGSDLLPRQGNNKLGSTTGIENVIGENESSRGTLVLHNVACNEGKTNDGIVKGGERLVDEMLEVIRAEVKQQRQRNEQNKDLPTERKNDNPQSPVDVTVSIIGNSLGGLYGRYAVARLSEALGGPEEPTRRHHFLDGDIRVHFNVFCSTASPHLGCAGHTYLPLPRVGEIGVARAIGETGSDLFRLNDLVRDMATSPRFLLPLASFRRRIAYANAFGTDFPVPGSTAAFLDGDSDYPHYFDEDYFAEENEAGTNGTTREGRPASDRGLIAATLHTPRAPFDEDRIRSEEGGTDDLTAMSFSLDSLGWKKVFVDIRDAIPLTVALPVAMMPSSADDDPCPIRRLRAGDGAPVKSCDLERAVSTSGGRRLGLPLGHNAICAFSRGRLSASVNSGGRPVMDGLATDLIDEISSWNDDDGSRA